VPSHESTTSDDVRRCRVRAELRLVVLLALVAVAALSGCDHAKPVVEIRATSMPVVTAAFSSDDSLLVVGAASFQTGRSAVCVVDAKTGQRIAATAKSELLMDDRFVNNNLQKAIQG
jgi:hypothetical protein